MNTKVVPTLTHAERIELIDEVGQKVYNSTESWRMIGTDLAYLFWAIATHSFVEWPDEPRFQYVRSAFERTFPKEHRVWCYIQL